MPKQQQEQQTSASRDQKEAPSTLPKAMQKRISLKWLTVEALGDVTTRLAHTGVQPKILFFTAFGQIEGRLQELRSSYAESFSPENGRLRPDISSMVTHVRSELLRTYEKEEPDLEIVDAAPILSLSDVVVTNGQGLRTLLPQLTLFADQVIGFTLTPLPEVP